MKDRQKYKKALEDIGCILSDVCNDFYEDGRKAYMVDTIKQNDFSYQRGLEDGKKAVEEQAEKITYADINEAYQRGIKDAVKTVKWLFFNVPHKDLFDGNYVEDILNLYTWEQITSGIKAYKDKERQIDTLEKVIYGQTLDEMKEDHGVWNVSFTLAKEPQEQEEPKETEEINILKTIDDNVGCDNCPLGYDDDECEFVTECPITKAIDKAVDAIKQMRKESECEKCLYAEETDGSHCYECVKGESKFEPQESEE